MPEEIINTEVLETVSEGFDVSEVTDVIEENCTDLAEQVIENTPAYTSTDVAKGVAIGAAAGAAVTFVAVKWGPKIVNGVKNTCGKIKSKFSKDKPVTATETVEVDVANITNVNEGEKSKK